MKKSFWFLLLSVLLVFTFATSACTTQRNPIASSSTSKPSSQTQSSTSKDSTESQTSSTSIDIINPTVNSSATGTVTPEVVPGTSQSVLPVNPSVSGQSSSSSSSGWLANIYDTQANPTPDYEDGFDDSVKYDYSNVTYTAKQGSVTQSGTTYTTTDTNTIAVNTSVPFPYGSISVDMNYNGGDSGLIFGYKNTSSSSTWEGNGISFYFLFLSANSFILGKSTNGTWSNIGNKYLGPNDTKHTYNIRAVVISNKITCIIDNVYAFQVTDSAFLTSTGFGFRAGTSGTTFTDIKVDNSYSCVDEDYKLDNGEVYSYTNSFTTKQGSFSSSGNTHQSTAANSLMVNYTSTTPFRYGSIECTFTPSTAGDNGIIFGYSNWTTDVNWEGEGLSYYFLFINYQGIVILGKTDNNQWSTVAQSNGKVVSNFSVAQKLTLVYKERAINVYLNDILLFSTFDSSPLFGAGYGIRAGNSGISFTNFTVTSSYLK